MSSEIDDLEPRGIAFSSASPSDEELTALEASIDDQMYCGNDVLILIREVRRLREEYKAACEEAFGAGFEAGEDLR